MSMGIVNLYIEEVNQSVVEITKAEAEAIRKKYPYAPISKTCHMKNTGNRGKRYICEDKKYMVLLSQIRKAENVIETYGNVL